MDTYISNDYNYEGEGATFGEYRTTTKVNGVQSSFTPSVDAIPSAEAEFGDNNASTNIYSTGNTFQTDNFESTAFGSYTESSNYNEFNTNYNTSADILQETSGYGDIGTKFDENIGIGVDSIKTDSVHPIDAFPPGGDFMDGNIDQITETFQTDNPIIDSGVNYGDFQTTDTTTSPYVDTGSTYDNFQSTTYESTTNYEANTNQYDSSVDVFKSSNDDAGAQFGEYRTTTKVNGVESAFMPDVDALPSADSLLETNDFTTNTYGDSSANVQSYENTTTTTTTSSPVLDVDVDSYLKNTTSSTYETNTDLNVNLDEYTHDLGTGDYNITNYDTSNVLDNIIDTNTYSTFDTTATDNIETKNNYETTTSLDTYGLSDNNYDITTNYDTTKNVDTTTNFDFTTNYDDVNYFDTSKDVTKNDDLFTNVDVTTNYDTTATNINTETKYDISSQNYEQIDYTSTFNNDITKYETTPAVDNNLFKSLEPIVDTTTNYDTVEYPISNQTFQKSQKVETTKTTSITDNVGSYQYSDPLLDTDLTTFTTTVPSLDITTPKATTAFKTVSQKQKTSTSLPFDIDSYLLKEPIVDTFATQTTNYKSQEGKKYDIDSTTLTNLIDPFPQIPSKTTVNYQSSSPDLDLLNLDKYTTTSTSYYDKGATYSGYQTISQKPVDLGISLDSYAQYKPKPKTGASFGTYDTITMSKTYSPDVEPNPVKQTTIVTLPPPNPIYIKKPDPIIVKVPKVHQVVVPKVHKVYVPSKSKIYIQTPSTSLDVYDLPQYSYTSTPHHSHHSHHHQSYIDPNVSLVPIPKIKQSKSLVPIPRVPGSNILISQLLPQPTISNAAVSVAPYSYSQVDPYVSGSRHRHRGHSLMTINPSDPNNYLAAHRSQSAIGRRRHKRYKPGQYISRAYKARKL